MSRESELKISYTKKITVLEGRVKELEETEKRLRSMLDKSLKSNRELTEDFAKIYTSNTQMEEVLKDLKSHIDGNLIDLSGSWYLKDNIDKVIISAK